MTRTTRTSENTFLALCWLGDVKAVPADVSALIEQERDAARAELIACWRERWSARELRQELKQRGWEYLLPAKRKKKTKEDR